MKRKFLTRRVPSESKLLLFAFLRSFLTLRDCESVFAIAVTMFTNIQDSSYVKQSEPPNPSHHFLSLKAWNSPSINSAPPPPFGAPPFFRCSAVVPFESMEKTPSNTPCGSNLPMIPSNLASALRDATG